MTNRKIKKTNQDNNTVYKFLYVFLLTVVASQCIHTIICSSKTVQLNIKKNELNKKIQEIEKEKNVLITKKGQKYALANVENTQNYEAITNPYTISQVEKVASN